MTDPPSLSVTISFSNGTVTRKFLNGYGPSDYYGKEFSGLKKKMSNIAGAFAGIHGEDKSELNSTLKKHVFRTAKRPKNSAAQSSIFEEEWPVDWHLQDFFNVIKFYKDTYAKFAITVKACGQHYYYSLEGKKDDGVWRLIQHPFFHKAPPPDSSGSTEPEQEKVRGLADTLLFLAPNLILFSHQYEVIEFLKWFEIRLDCEVTRANTNTLNLAITPGIRKGKAISLPCGQKSDKLFKVILSSANFRDAVAALEEVWLNPTAKAVLISAWPGSGKEVLVDLLKTVLSIDEKLLQIGVAAPALGTFDKLRDILVKECFSKVALQVSSNSPLTFPSIPPSLEQKVKYDASNSQLVFFSPISRDDTAELRQLFHEENLKKQIEELCRKSRELQCRTFLFLDEIHHDGAADIRTGLLRLMESGKLELPTGELLDCKKILYVLVGSIPPEEMRTRKPPDLWTRVEHTVVLRHPLLIDDRGERLSTLKDYFNLFWDMQKEDWKNLSEATAESPEKKANNFERLNSQLSDLIEKLSEIFTIELGSPLIRLISIRELRTVVKRLFARTLTYLRMHPKYIPANSDGPLENEFRKWIVEVFNEVVPGTDGRRPF